jgi:tetratricopeptide (TPR) repeat protein
LAERQDVRTWVTGWLTGWHARRDWLAALALVALPLLAHAPALDGGWIIDDAQYVVDNRLLDDAPGLATIWREPKALKVYYPLVFTTFWVERHLCGIEPSCFHLTNLLLHAAVTLLAWWLLRRLAVPAAWLAAALFAVHPIHVDTVAWVAERKNVLSGLFALAALLLYLRFDERREAGRPDRRWLYLASLASFLLAMLSKTAILGLPLVAGLLLWWRRGRITARDLAPLAPMVLLGAALSVVTVVVEKGLVGGGDAIPSPPLVERPFLAARVTLFYLGKLAWPAGLSFDYGHWPTALAEPANLGAALALAGGIAALWAGRRRWGAGPLVAILAFLCLAGPALGLVTFYFHRYSFVADHFVYLPSLPILALYAGAGARLLGRRPRRWPGVVVAAAVLVALGATTWRHARDYRNHETLGRAIVRVNPSSWLGHNHLGNEALRRREFAAALDHLERAEQIAPGRIETQLNLALARMNAGDLAGAEQAARRAVSIRDGAAIAHLVLGDALLRAERFDEAVGSYTAALERDPRLPRALSGLGLAQSRAGRHEAAVATLTAALGEDPANVAARTGLAYSLAQLGRRDEAIAELERALALAPDDPRLRRNLELLRAGGPR